MKRTLKQRVVVSLVATVVAAACGLLIGYWIGRAITLRQTAGRLGHEAARAISENNTYAHDVHAALDAMNASRYSYCSVEDMEFLHHLLYASIFLKETGRIRDNKIVCSTTQGREHLSSAELPKPDAIGTDGVKVYRDPLFFGLPNVAVVALRAGDSYVVLYPYFDSLRERSAIRMQTTANTVSQSLSAPQAEKDSRLAQPILTRDSDFRVGEIMYSTRCSSLAIDNICITASLPVSEALGANRGELKAFNVLGGLIGGCFGLLVAFLYRRNRSMEQQLRRAIRKDNLRVEYQQIVSLSSGRIVGAEALARWTDEDGFAVGPDIFIKLAEERGFVGAITKLVVQRALRDFAATLRARPEFRLSINVAAMDLSDPEFQPMLERALKRAGVAAKSLIIEITESSTARHETAIAAILRLHERGHSVHIDDFGTGYSSLSYLHSLSVDAIKIDRSFTRTIGTESITVAILPQILAMAEALKLQVIVEGIETGQQAEYFSPSALTILGQGWLYGRAVAPDEFQRLLAEDEKKARDGKAKA
ncbi:MAG: EAL domain-containing protein [Terracidiphilus sp.]